MLRTFKNLGQGNYMDIPLRKQNPTHASDTHLQKKAKERPRVAPWRKQERDSC